MQIIIRDGSRIPGDWSIIGGKGNFELFKFHVVVQYGTLLEYCRRYETSANARPGKVAWERWADRARLLPLSGYEAVHNSICYRQCLTVEGHMPDEHGYMLQFVMLYDFLHPAATRYEGARAQTAPSGATPWQYVLEPSIIVDKRIFKSMVISNLPYRKVHTGYVAQEEPPPGPQRREHYYLVGECILSVVTEGGRTS